MEKYFILICRIIFVLALFVLICGKFKTIGHFFIYKEESKVSYPGDLYVMCKINQFKEDTPIKEYSETSEVSNCAIITLGDSFFTTTRDSYILASELENSLEKVDIYNVSIEDAQKCNYNPLKFLENINFKKSCEKKILILESAERYSLERALSYYPTQHRESNKLKIDFFKKTKSRFFNHDDVDYFFKENILTYHINKYLKNLKFDYFHEIDRRIGAFSLMPSMLFYFEEIDFNKKNITTDEIECASKNLKRMAVMLKNDYNVDLVYLIIPNKYSVYNDYINKVNNYNKYINKINNSLKQNNVNVVDVFSRYLQYRKKDDSKLIYYRSDTHYTAFGKHLLIDEIINFISSNNLMKVKSRAND